jgi:hypothetical protein
MAGCQMVVGHLAKSWSLFSTLRKGRRAAEDKWTTLASAPGVGGITGDCLWSASEKIQVDQRLE